MSKQQDSPDIRQLETAIRIYYTGYYRDQLGLPDWLKRVEARLDEEHNYAEPVIKKVEGWINYNFEGKRVLVVGAGTGAESVMLARRGAQVFAMEPDAQALEIIHLKTRVQSIDSLSSIAAVAESIPFPGCHFDFVYCYSVLEHVWNVESTLDEMIRVCKPDGYIFIQTPDYRQFYEPHYKLFMPVFAPKWALRLLLRIMKRPIAFLNTLSFINAKKLRNIFQHRPVTAFQVIHSWPRSWLFHAKYQLRLIRWITQTLGIQRDQWWLLKKLEAPR